MIPGSLIGLLALAAIPVLVLIYLLQQRPRDVPTSLLFLLDDASQRSRAGRRIERWRNSLSFWLLLLALLLLAFLLLRPRFVLEVPSRRIAIVLDASFSMDAYRDATLEAVDEAVKQLSRGARRQHLLLLSSDLAEATLYSGDDPAGLSTAAANWKPTTGTHDNSRALAIARQAVGEDGVVLWLSDHPWPDAPPGVVVRSVGQALDNVGFGGAQVRETAEGPVLSTLVINHSPAPQTRTWTARSDGAATQAREIALAPGEARELAMPFPPNGKLTLELSGDALALDDVLPAVRPRPRVVAVAQHWGADGGPEIGDLLAALPSLAQNQVTADLHIGWQAVPEQPSIVFDPWPEGSAGIWPGPTVLETHPYVAGQNWDALAVRQPPAETPQVAGTILVWRSGRPLVSLTTGEQPILHLHLDPRQSNLLRLPAFVVLVSRFIEDIRAGLPRTDTANLELGQVLAATGTLAVEPADAAPPPPPAPARRAPFEPAFFTVQSGEQTALRAAAQFADVREANLTLAAPADALPEALRETRRREATNLPWLEKLLLLCIAAALMGAWWTERNRRLA